MTYRMGGKLGPSAGQFAVTIYEQHGDEPAETDTWVAVVRPDRAQQILDLLNTGCNQSRGPE